MKALKQFEPQKHTDNYRLKAYQGSSSNRLLKAIYYRNEIHLTEAQIDVLLSYYKKSVKIKNDQGYVDPKSDKLFEYARLKKVLNAAQFESWLQCYYRPGALQQAQREWEQLEKYGLVHSVHRNAIIKEITSNELNLRISRELRLIGYRQESVPGNDK